MLKEVIMLICFTYIITFAILEVKAPGQPIAIVRSVSEFFPDDYFAEPISALQ